ncbi:MAG: DNA-binding domain-containing protein [Burkholderiaceae bacterium]
MHELFAIQRDLAGALNDVNTASRAERWLVGDAVLIERRLAIYRANVSAAATKALGAAYPVVRQVVGEAFFDALAHAYQRVVPSTSGDLSDCGAAFAGFVAEFPHTQSLPYLADLARLEWAVHRAYGAEDAPAWDQQALAQIAPGQQAAICFDWAAGTAVVESNFPIARVWRIHQPGFEGDFSVDGSVRECALVAREGFRVAVSALDAGDAAFIASGLAGAALGASTEVALAADRGFDLGHLLGRLMASNVICGFSTDKDE